MDDKDKPQTYEESRAWDSYACAALHLYSVAFIPNQRGDAEIRAEYAARLADAMLVERRKRYEAV